MSDIYFVYSVKRENFSNYNKLSLEQRCVFDFIFDTYLIRLDNLDYIKKNMPQKICVEFALKVCSIYFNILISIGGNYILNNHTSKGVTKYEKNN